MSKILFLLLYIRKMLIFSRRLNVSGKKHTHTHRPTRRSFKKTTMSLYPCFRHFFEITFCVTFYKRKLVHLYTLVLLLQIFFSSMYICIDKKLAIHFATIFIFLSNNNNKNKYEFINSSSRRDFLYIKKIMKSKSSASSYCVYIPELKGVYI